MGDTLDDEPSDAAYGIATETERYRLLHERANRLIDQLVEQYSPERVDGIDTGSSYASAWPDSPAVTLTPLDGAPLTFVLTAFPGVAVRYGFCGEDMFPSCGCDGCDEDPGDEARRMTELVRQVVEGGFSETRRRRPLQSDWYEAEMIHKDGRSTSGHSLDHSRDADQLPHGTTVWVPWGPWDPTP